MTNAELREIEERQDARLRNIKRLGYTEYPSKMVADIDVLLTHIREQREEIERLVKICENTYCVFCGATFPLAINDKATAESDVVRHIHECKEHPLYTITCERDRLTRRVEELEGALHNERIAFAMEVLSVRAFYRSDMHPRIAEALQNIVDEAQKKLSLDAAQAAMEGDDETNAYTQGGTDA